MRSDYWDRMMALEIMGFGEGAFGGSWSMALGLALMRCFTLYRALSISLLDLYLLPVNYIVFRL
jgi:hypothetical protein